MNDSLGSQTIAAILKHDNKVTSYKIALLRAINDVVLAFPDVATHVAGAATGVAVPLHLLAERWVAYYWPFMDAERPIYQGPRAFRDGVKRNDVDFRPFLTQLRLQWEQFQGAESFPADGFLLLADLSTPRRRKAYPLQLSAAFDATVRAITRTLQMPIRYAGPGEWTIFEKPCRWRDLATRNNIAPVPGTHDSDVCLVISGELWMAFQELSLWIEALSIHQWCLFTENVAQTLTELGDLAVVAPLPVNRGYIYFLLTARPDNRRPLTWERNQIDILMMEGERFICPWTRKALVSNEHYDLDHLLPLAIYPINELWNLLPVDKRFNQHVKRHRVPSCERLQEAESLLAQGYAVYEKSSILKQAISQDAHLRFSRLPGDDSFPRVLAHKTVNFIEEVARARGVVRF